MFSFIKNIYHITIILVLFFFTSCESFTTNSIPENTIKEYHIKCDTNDFSRIYKNYKDNEYIQIKISYNGETRIARMRIRGDTSRKNHKKSLKIKFDSLRIDNLPKTLNLNAEYSDKTYIRQYLSSKLMQSSGQICFQTEHVKLFINGEFYGLYLQVEKMGKNFLKRNKLQENGNLYKASKDGACLSIFDDFDAKWEKKTNKKSDHNDLTKLIDDINNVPDSSYQAFIKKTFEYDELINLIALNMSLSNSSTYYHNYYLYHDLYTNGKWKMLPWDMDKTLSYYNWMPYTYHRTSSEWESDNPLIERAILCKPIFLDIKKRIDTLHKTLLNNNYITPIIDSLTSILSDIIPLDTTDEIKTIEEWKNQANAEKNYFNKHYLQLQTQFTKQPLSFNVFRFNQVQTDIVTFKWQKSEHPQHKKVTYILSYGTDFLLTDSSKTKYITNITDTFYSLKKRLPEGIYYWKITAFDGEHYTDGFNSKNIFIVKKGTQLPTTISNNLTLKKNKSPYIISKNISIKAGVTLTIEAGVEIYLKQDVNIECFGNMITKGTANQPITFMPDNTAKYWGYIYFYESTNQAYLKNVIIKEGTLNSKGKSLTIDSCTVLVDVKPMGTGSKRLVILYTNKGIVNIKNSHFKSNGFGEGMVLFYSEINTENCYFEYMPDAIEYIQVNKGVIRNNLVIASGDDAIDLNACNNILIEKNILLYSKDKGVSIGTEQYGASLNNIQVKNNLIMGNGMAIGIKDSSVAYISNNTLFKNHYGIHAYKKREDYTKGGTAYIKNTIFEKNEKSNIFIDGLSTYQINNSIANNTVLEGKGNFKGDPKFIDASRYNFHLTPNSPCVGKGENNEDIGAFNSNSTTVSLSKIHIKSSKEKKTRDWIEITNNYNIPVDLSLYKITINDGNQKEYLFPIGTTLDRLGKLYIAADYYYFSSYFKNITTVIGGLPNLSTNKTTIQLVNQNGYVLDSYTYSISLKEEENITFISNGINDKKSNSWKILTK